MKGARQLCGMYDTANVQRPSVSCYCTREKLHDVNYRCKPVYEKDMFDILEKRDNGTNREIQLKSISQHDGVLNAFNQLDKCGWPHGIWGLCPSEVLHQFYEGVLIYALEEFLEVFLKNKMRNNLSKWMKILMDSVKNQSCRDDYPNGVFTLGINRYKSMKGIEKFACIYFLSLFLHTKVSTTEYFEGRKDMSDPDMKRNLIDWRKLFETSCYYHDYLCGERFCKDELGQQQIRIGQFHKLFQKMVQRNGEGIENIPKFHEFFHITRNIKWHGPPTGYSTLTTESIHKSVKAAANNTAKHVASFPIQTGLRMFENNLIDNSMRFVNKFAKSLYVQELPNKNSTEKEKMHDNSNIGKK